MQDEVRVSQAAREFLASLFQHIGRVTQKDAQNICEGEWDGTSDLQMVAKFEQFIRHQAERETLARMEPVAWQVTFESASGRQWCRKIVLTEPDPKDWDSVTPLYALPPAPEAGQ